MSSKNKNLSPADRLRLMQRFKSLIVQERTSQKEACNLCGISEKTGCAWMKELGLTKMTKAEILDAANKRDTDSLSYFMGWCSKHVPHLYPTVDNLF